MSGDFTEKGLTDNIRGLTSGDVLGIEEWLSFYEKDYKYVGEFKISNSTFWNLFFFVQNGQV